MIKPLLDHYADYNVWANARFVERLSREDDETLDAVVPSSFPSFRATVLHIRNAENTWYGRVLQFPTSWPANDSLELGDPRVHSEQLRDAVIGLSENEMTTERVYHDLRGNRHSQPVWEMVMHCFNHSTQHRGQLITMMRVLGLGDIPSNDMVQYQRGRAT